jgi:hypothetical protein
VRSPPRGEDDEEDREDAAGERAAYERIAHAPARRAAAIRGMNSRCQTSSVNGEMNL